MELDNKTTGVIALGTLGTSTHMNSSFYRIDGILSGSADPITKPSSARDPKSKVLKMIIECNLAVKNF